jgi:hypothetical protein
LGGREEKLVKVGRELVVTNSDPPQPMVGWGRIRKGEPETLTELQIKLHYVVV